MATGPSGSASAQVSKLTPDGPATRARPASSAPAVSPIWGFIARRIALGFVVLFLVSIVVFLATQGLGDPARAILGRGATPASLAALRDQLHLDRPLIQQYLSWAAGL